MSAYGFDVKFFRYYRAAVVIATNNALDRERAARDLRPQSVPAIFVVIWNNISDAAADYRLRFIPSTAPPFASHTIAR